MTDRLFVYGTLKPGASAWPLLQPHATGSWPATLPGALYDTGRGYPALLLGDGPGAAGWVVELRSPSAAVLSAMDSYEGSEYQRVLVTLPDGTECWTYVWVEEIAGMARLEVW